MQYDFCCDILASVDSLGTEIVDLLVVLPHGIRRMAMTFCKNVFDDAPTPANEDIRCSFSGIAF